MITVFDLARADTQLRRASVHEQAGPCPGCGGQDRFRVRQSEHGWSFMCRGCWNSQEVLSDDVAKACGKRERVGERRGWGDAIDYLRHYRKMTYQQAHAYLCDEQESSERAFRNTCRKPAQGPLSLSRTWQEQTRKRVEQCVEALWSPIGATALDYARRRGLSDEMLRSMQAGYSLHGGIGHLVIPNFHVEGQQIVYSAVYCRDLRPDAPKDLRWKDAAGSSKQELYLASCLERKMPTVLTEGILDAAVLAQEAGDLVNVVSTAGTQGGRTIKNLASLACLPQVLVAFDADADGDKASGYWLSRLKNARRFRPFLHDINEMFLDGWDIRQWVIDELAKDDPLIALSDACAKCGLPVEWYSDQGEAYCDLHWQELQGIPVDVSQVQQLDRLSHVQPSYTIVTEPEGVAALRLADETYVLDLETTGLEPDASKVITIAFGRPGCVTIIDTRSYSHAPEPERKKWQTALQQLLHNEGVTWIGHNIKFDWRHLSYHFGVQLAHVEDTMLVEKLLHNGETPPVSASMMAVAARYEIPVTKEERNWFIDLDKRPHEWSAPLPAAQIAYIIQDIEVPWYLREKQQPLLQQWELGRVVNLEHEALPAVAAMEHRGVLVDVQSWRALLVSKQRRSAELEQQIQAHLARALLRDTPIQQTGLFGEVETPTVQLSSSEQLRRALSACGVDLASTDREALEDSRDDHEVVPLLLEWKEIEKLLSAFGESFLSKVRSDGRIHADFAQLGAESGRIICRSPNIQQVPKPGASGTDLRSCFIAPAGYKLLIADLSNIELRILAEVSNDSTMLRLFAEGKDLHAETARVMFGLHPDTNTKKHLINGRSARDIAKTVNFGLAYGMGAGGLARRIDVDLDSAKKLMAAYFRAYQGVDRYLRRSGREALQRGYATSLSGRRRSFPTNTHRDTALYGRYERAAKNHPIQGTNADILKRALALLSQQLPEGVHIVMAIHDELVLECPLACVSEAKSVLQQCMVEACRMFLKKVEIETPEVFENDHWMKG